MASTELCHKFFSSKSPRYISDKSVCLSSAMPSLARFLKSSRLNIQLLLAILGMYTLVFKFTGPGKSSQFYSVTFMDIFMEKVLLDQKDSNLIEHIRNEMLSHPKPFEKVRMIHWIFFFHQKCIYIRIENHVFSFTNFFIYF